MVPPHQFFRPGFSSQLPGQLFQFVFKDVRKAFEKHKGENVILELRSIHGPTNRTGRFPEPVFQGGKIQVWNVHVSNFMTHFPAGKSSGLREALDRPYNYPLMNLPVKYRPRRFAEITGQEHVTRTLYNALKEQRIAPAYLFAGPRGVGKTTSARILAKGLNCEKGITPEPCNQCTVCQEIDRGHSLDVIEIDGASNRGIDQIRELRENIRLMPTRGRFRVYIIDEVHMLTPEAFNALLKTLEEPPPHAVFIFATTDPQKVPETVLSRTQRFDFRPLTEEDIAGRLQEIARAEGMTVSEKALLRIARFASGSMRDAIALLEQVWVFANGPVEEEHVLHLLGTVRDEDYLTLLDAVQRRDVRSALELVDRLFGRGVSPQEFTRGFQEILRRLLRARAGVETSSLTPFARKLAIPDLLAWLRATQQLEEAVKYSTFPRVWVDYHVARLCYLPRTLEIQSLLEVAGVTAFQTPPQPSRSKPTPSPPSQAPTVEGFLQHLEQRAPVLADLLRQSQLSLQGQTLQILVPEPRQRDEIAPHLQEIQEEARAWWKTALEVQVQARVQPEDPRFLKLKEAFKLEEVPHV